MVMDFKSFPQKLPQYLAAIGATGGAFATGTIYGWSAPAGPMIMKGKELDFSVTEYQFSWIVSVMPMGAAFMCIPAGILMKKIGRKYSILLFLIPMILGWVTVIWAQCIYMMYFGRLLLGFSVGAYSTIIPIYIGEIAEKEIRGSLGICYVLMINAGVLFAYLIGYGTNVFNLGIICSLIPMCYGVVFLFMPETPTYLVGLGHKFKASQSIAWLRGKEYDATNIEEEIEEIQCIFDIMRANTASNFEALRYPTTVRAFTIMFGLMIFCQLSGIHAVVFFATAIFIKAGINMNADVATVIVGSIYVLGTLIALFMVDKVGRRLLLMVSSILMACCTVTIGVYFTFLEQDASRVVQLNWVAIVAMCLYVAVYSLGFGSIPWLMLGELFSSDIKGLASSLNSAVFFTLSFSVTKGLLSTRTLIGIGPTFWMFSTFSLLGCIFVYFIVPETKGKSLMEIQRDLVKNSKIKCMCTWKSKI